MSNYGIYQSTPSGRGFVDDYESLLNHHPGQNFQEPGRTYGHVDGEHEEIRQESGEVLVSKDFVLFDSSIGVNNPNNVTPDAKDVSVPAPIAGKVKVNEAQGKVEIYDPTTGELLARIRHMSDIDLKTGDVIEYGQPMGKQSNVATAHVHTHIDFNVERLDQFKQYFEDIKSGAISQGVYPAQSQPRPFSNPDDYGSLEVPTRYAAIHGQVGERIGREFSTRNIEWSNGGDNTVAACTVECVKQNVTDIQQVNVENGKIFLGQKTGFEWNVASVDAVQAAQTPKQESFAQLAALDLQQSQKLDNPVQTQTKTQSGPSIG